MINAIVLIHARPQLIPETAQAIADLDGVEAVYSCAGDIDLIAVLRVRDHDEIAGVVTSGINRLDGVEKTSTHIAFQSFSRSEVEEAFSIGE